MTDDQKPTHIAPAIDEALAAIIKRNVEQITKRKEATKAKHVPKPARTEQELTAELKARGLPVPGDPGWTYMAKKQAEGRMNRRQAPERVDLRLATELCLDLAMFRYKGLVFLSKDMILWRATANYARLVERMKAEQEKLSLAHPEPVLEGRYDAIFKSLTSPVLLPKGIELVKPEGWALACTGTGIKP